MIRLVKLMMEILSFLQNNPMKKEGYEKNLAVMLLNKYFRFDV